MYSSFTEIKQNLSSREETEVRKSGLN